MTRRPFKLHCSFERHRDVNSVVKRSASPDNWGVAGLSSNSVSCGLRRHTRALECIAVLLCGAAAACSGDSAATSPSQASTIYEGRWSGSAMRQQCSVDGIPRVDCGLSIFLPLTVTLTQTGSRVEGTVALNAIFINVAGTVGGGELSLSGQGTGTNGSVTLNEWRTTDRNGAMTGQFTYAIVTPGNLQPITVNAVLDGVVKSGATPVPAPIPEPPFRLIVRPASARNFGSEISYSACYWMENYAPFSAVLTMTVTPIGADGRDYDVEQVVFQGPEYSIRMRTTQSGCGGGAARDRNVSRPIATSYRLRVDYQYANGVSGSAEERGAVSSP